METPKWNSAQDVFLQGAEFFGSICVFCNEENDVERDTIRGVLDSFLSSISQQLTGFKLHQIFWFKEVEEVGKLVDLNKVEGFSKGTTLIFAVGKENDGIPEHRTLSNQTTLETLKKNDELNSWIMAQLPMEFTGLDGSEEVPPLPEDITTQALPKKPEGI
ncbi:MAG: hypothetical protein GOV00_01480 [Candidatus Altiarchaeota archaeon]|nr:hypothetical protein [Candidatus Altiarchaeota archaeon]